ncbi:unnamed protein product [Brassica oleracea var. botrytis]
MQEENVLAESDRFGNGGLLCRCSFSGACIHHKDIYIYIMYNIYIYILCIIYIYVTYVNIFVLYFN